MSALRGDLAALTLQAEDAPQLTNRVDLDPAIRDVFRQPVPLITYANSRFELDARTFYSPQMLNILKATGAQYGFIAPQDSPSQSAHIMVAAAVRASARGALTPAGAPSAAAQKPGPPHPSAHPTTLKDL